MATVSFDRSDQAGGPVSRADLVTGMQLLRAVNMQSIRLQLAMLRRDQQPAMESLDSLAAMDREIEHFIDGIGPTGFAAAELRDITELVTMQKRALAAEKLYLTAGISGPALRPSMPDNIRGNAEAEANQSMPAPDPSEYRPAGRWAGRIALGLALVIAGATALLFWSGAPILG